MINGGKNRRQRLHAKFRAKQRYNFKLTPEVHKDIVKMIQTNQANFIEKLTNRLTKWKVQYDTEEFWIVYDKRSKNIATFLPKNAK